MSCDCGCSGSDPISKGQRNILDGLREGVLWDLPQTDWDVVVAQVEEVGDIRKTTGSVQTILYGAIRKASQGFGGDRSAAGRYAAEQRWKNQQRKQQMAQGMTPTTPMGNAPQKPQAEVMTDNPKEALDALRQGKTVAMGDAKQVNTLIEELHKFTKEAKAKGEKVKLNLCKVSVPGTNLFCGDSLTGPDGKPIPRDKMPQLAGKPKKGSPVDDPKKFPVDKDGEVNVGEAFEKHLEAKGIGTKIREVPANMLKASQSELKGKNVAFMMSPEGQKAVGLDTNTIYVSKDGYVIDGHHRWAAKVGLDGSDGKLGDMKMKVKVIDMPIQDVLREANAFTSIMGIEPKSA